jgi:hypothetical protein
MTKKKQSSKTSRRNPAKKKAADILSIPLTNNRKEVIVKKIPILGILALLLSIYYVYTPYLTYDYFTTPIEPIAVTDPKSTFLIKYEFYVNINNPSWKTNMLDEIKIVPICQDSAVELLEVPSIEKKHILPFQSAKIHVQFWLRNYEVIVNCEDTNSIEAECYPVRLFFLDKYGNQIRIDKEDDIDNGTTLYGSSISFKPIAENFRSLLRKKELPYFNRYTFRVISYEDNGRKGTKTKIGFWPKTGLPSRFDRDALQ